jgi:hypothetical protein
MALSFASKVHIAGLAKQNFSGYCKGAISLASPSSSRPLPQKGETLLNFFNGTRPKLQLQQKSKRYLLENCMAPAIGEILSS